MWRVENCNNGNWSDAAQNAVDYGFYTNDIANMDPNAELWVDGATRELHKDCRDLIKLGEFPEYNLQAL